MLKINDELIIWVLFGLIVFIAGNYTGSAASFFAGAECAENGPFIVESAHYTRIYNTTHRVYENVSIEEITINYPQNEFQKIAIDVAAFYDYSDSFDCTQFCEETKARLSHKGWGNMRIITTKMGCGSLDMTGYALDRDSCLKHSGRHDILKLGDFGYLECINGFIISPNDYKKYGI